VGRRHLSRLLPLLVALVVVASAAAASTIPFRVAARSITDPSGATAKPFAILGTSALTAHRIVVRVPPEAAQPVLEANFRRSIVLGVFGPFGCKDGRVHVTRVTQAERTLTVHLAIKPLAPGMMECLAIYETVRVLVVPRAALHGTPTKVTVTVAGS
jgi:hypothetical protein